MCIEDTHFTIQHEGFPRLDALNTHKSIPLFRFPAGFRDLRPSLGPVSPIQISLMMIFKGFILRHFRERVDSIRIQPKS